MFRTFYEDRHMLENKFHKTDEPFNGFARRATHGYDYDPTTGLSDQELLEGLDRLSAENEGLPHPIAKAKAIAYVLANTRIDVNPSDYFVGFWSTNRLIYKTTVLKWNNEIFDNLLPETRDEIAMFCDSGATNLWPDFDHVVPAWDSILGLGFAGLRERARHYRELHRQNGTLTPEMDAHFEGIEIHYTAILELMDRLCKLAESRTHEKASTVARCLRHLRDGAPTNIYEAMQLIYIYFILSDDFDYYQVRSLGHGLDASLYPFYRRDLENGTFTREEIREFLAYFLMQWSAIGNIMGQPLYIAGTHDDGTTKVNDLTWDIVEVYDELGIHDPKIQVKVDTSTPADFILRIMDNIRRGHTAYVFCCEPAMMKAAMSYGATEKEARNIDIRGCYEIGIRADEVSTTSGYVNGAKAVEYVFTNGFDTRIQKQIGLQTGPLSALETFEDFYAAVLKQWLHFIDRSIAMTNAYEPYLGVINPSTMYSATVENSLKKGVDAYQGGVKFNNTTILCCSFASMVNSLMAVKEFVYDKKKLSLEELAKVLEANWEGFDALRMEVLRSPHKYGNNDPLADRYAAALADYFTLHSNGRPNARNGVYKVDMHSAYMFIWQGEKTMATPDGRKAGEELSKNASPAPGTDRNGVTALIHSALKLTPSHFPESLCVDLMLHPSAVQGDEGLAIMKAVLDTYLAGGGMCMQFNIFDVNTLLDAQKHPENYKNLQVRVCGWNSHWNDLSRHEQDGYILRAKNIQQ